MGLNPSFLRPVAIPEGPPPSHSVSQSTVWEDGSLSEEQTAVSGGQCVELAFRL